MLLEKLETSKYKELMREHILSTIEYLFDANQEFGVACEISTVTFVPSIPKEITDTLPEITLFMLANYSFETASVDVHTISFEAGFGAENIGATVHIPLLAIKQLFVEEYPILINITSSHEENTKEEKEESINSMAALLNNPENAKLLKKKKS